MLSSAGGGLGIAVFNFDFLTVDAGAVINVVGSRPLALLAVDTLSFAGTINANGGNGATVSAPLSGALGGIGVAGGGNGGRGGFTGNGGGFGAGLGGGAGGVVLGGAALDGGGGGFGGAGLGYPPVGVTYGNLLLRLDAGSGGGGGASVGGSAGAGGAGAGGGAIELGALSAVTLSGAVNVNGGVQGGGANGGANSGGGSGGGVLIHARNVTMSGYASANGGFTLYAGGGGRFAAVSVNLVGTSGVSVVGGGGLPINRGTITTAHGILTTTALDLGPVRVGTSKTAFMGIQNTGDADTSINGRFPDPASSGGSVFSRVGNGIFSALHQNRYSANPYTFTPTALGAVSESLNFLSDGGNASVGILGLGVGPLASANVAFGSAIDFGTISPVSTASASLTLDNSTSSNPFLPENFIGLTLENFTITGPDAAFFSLSGFTPGEVLGAGESAPMQVQFAPNGTLGAKTATLTFQSDQSAAFGAPGETFSFTLNGTAAVPEPATSTLIAFGLVCFGMAQRKVRSTGR